MGTLSDVASQTGGRLVGPDRPFAAVSTDTRNLKPGDLFFALRGERFDALEFVVEAARRGAAGAVVEMRQSLDIPQVEVADSRLALADFAKAWRARFSLPVIGVTGSNGKTTVKEMTAAILREQFRGESEVLATSGNLNNEIGLPLMVLQLTDGHRAAVLEMGASKAGDIAYLAEIAQPAVAVITNAGAAHLEGFGSIDGVVRTKGEILDSLPPGGCAILNRDDGAFETWARRVADRMVLSFGLHEDAHVRAENIAEDTADGTLLFTLTGPTGDVPVRLGIPGLHNVGNALAAAAATLALDLPLDVITRGIEAYAGVPGRLHRRHLAGDVTLYDDSYNANPSSMAAAIDLLGSRPSPRWLVVGDMAELGEDSFDMHAAVGARARAAGIDRLLATGEGCRHTVAAFGDRGEWHEDRESIAAAIARELPRGATLLVKASRSSRMEEVIPAIEAAAAALGGEG